MVDARGGAMTGNRASGLRYSIKLLNNRNDIRFLIEDKLSKRYSLHS